MVGVPMHEPASFSCPDPKLFDAQIRKFEAIKHRQVVPAEVRRHATKGNRRLKERRLALEGAGKKPVVANCATAREMAGWVWALGRMAEG